jgi:uncharacterized membrane protein
VRPNNTSRIRLHHLARGALLAALYAGLTLALAGISFQAVQIRVAEALTVIPFFYPEAIWGLFLGALLANLASPFGWIDLLFGSLLTLVAAGITRGIGILLRPHLGRTSGMVLALVIAPLPAVLCNGFGVSAYLLQFGLLSGYTYWAVMLAILVGELIACYLLGGPLLAFLIVRYRKTGESNAI